MTAFGRHPFIRWNGDKCFGTQASENFVFGFLRATTVCTLSQIGVGPMIWISRGSENHHQTDINCCREQPQTNSLYPWRITDINKYIRLQSNVKRSCACQQHFTICYYITTYNSTFLGAHWKFDLSSGKTLGFLSGFLFCKNTTCGIELRLTRVIFMVFCPCEATERLQKVDTTRTYIR